MNDQLCLTHQHPNHNTLSIQETCLAAVSWIISLNATPVKAFDEHPPEYIHIPISLTEDSQAIRIGALCADDAPETFLLKGTVGLVEMSFTVTVHHAPLTVQHTETVTEIEIEIRLFEGKTSCLF